MFIFEVVNKASKAGFIPYCYRDNKPYFMFCKSSNAQFGGDQFMISKGHIDLGEASQVAAIREATEELGLIPTNLISSTVKLGWSGPIKGLTASYIMDIYIGEVNDPTKFNSSHYEVSEVKWMTIDEFMSGGRQSHKQIAKMCASKVPSK